jgi:hypothetical protein
MLLSKHTVDMFKNYSSVLLVETLSCQVIYSNFSVLLMKNVLFDYEINGTLWKIKHIMQRVLKIQ